MEHKGWFDGLVDSLKDGPEYRLETLILDITEKICERMEDLGINRKQLAEKIGISAPAITKVLRGNSNFKLKTLLTMADALETELNIDFKQKQRSPRIDPEQKQRMFRIPAPCQATVDNAAGRSRSPDLVGRIGPPALADRLAEP